MSEEDTEEKFPDLTDEQKAEAKVELELTDEEFKELKKKMRELKDRDDKAFMDMLRSTSRNHYTLNQMVDRKARIMLSLNAIILSFIIEKTVSHQAMFEGKFYLLVLFGIGCLISMVYSIIAVIPEKTHGGLDEGTIKSKQGNPLFFGNFKDMSEEAYENTMMEMVNDRDFIYRAMIQDIYHLGQILEKKRNCLRYALNIFVAGLFAALVFGFILRFLFHLS